MSGEDNIIKAITGIFVSILLVWVFWQIISQLNIWFAILFLIAAISVIAGAILSIFRR